MCEKCDALRDGNDPHAILDRARNTLVAGLLKMKGDVLQIGELAQAVQSHIPAGDPRRVLWDETFETMKRIDEQIVKLSIEQLRRIAQGPVVLDTHTGSIN